jgi:hypothetical protein
MTTVDIAQIIAAYAQAAATIIAAGAFYYLAKQVRGGARADDLKALVDFYQRAEDVEARLLREQDEARRQPVRYELLNFLEISSRAYLHRLYGKASSEIVRDKLIDSLATVFDNAEMQEIMKAGVTSPSSFSEIMNFHRKHRREIDGLIEARKAAITPTHTEDVNQFGPAPAV